MVEKYIASLRLTPEEYSNYNPPAGIDAILLEEEQKSDNTNVITAAFVGSDLFPQPLLQKTASDIRHEVLTTFRNRIVEDNLQTHPKLPPRLMKIETILDHPNVTSNVPRELKMAAEAATEVHDVELTKDQYEEIKRDPETGRELEARVKRKPIQTMERTGDGRMVVRDTGKVEETYSVSFGIIDIGG